MANKTRLDTTMESDFLQSFVRGNLTALQTEINHEKSPKIGETKKNTNGESAVIDVISVPDIKQSKSVRIVTPTSQVCSKFLAENAKQKLEKQAKRKTKRRTIKSEELYTDKDRAAAVNLGTRDIKQSLKLKQAQDRSKALHIPEQADPAQFIALGLYEMRKNNYSLAFGCINKALELNPNDKRALVSRSKCYIVMGQPENGLKDAETALSIDKKFLKAIYQKAEALYYLGDFEHSLMFFHRGLHIRPDHEGFKLGVEKAQKAIETALSVDCIGCNCKSGSKRRTSNINDDNNNLSIEKLHEGTSLRRSSKCKLLKELAVDKEYMESLLENPDLKYAKTKEIVRVLECVNETVDYLNKREEFWRQQAQR